MDINIASKLSQEEKDKLEASIFSKIDEQKPLSYQELSYVYSFPPAINGHSQIINHVGLIEDVTTKEVYPCCSVNSIVCIKDTPLVISICFAFYDGKWYPYYLRNQEEYDKFIENLEYYSKAYIDKGTGDTLMNLALLGLPKKLYRATLENKEAVIDSQGNYITMIDKEITKNEIHNS